MARKIEYDEDKVEEKLTDFGTGATRCSDADTEKYNLISPFFLRRLAKLMADGAETHGDSNWRLGIPIDVTFNHLIRHLFKWQESQITGVPSDEDELAKCAFGLMAICHYEEVGPRDYGTMIPLEDLKKHPDVKKS